MNYLLFLVSWWGAAHLAWFDVPDLYPEPERLE